MEVLLRAFNIHDWTSVSKIYAEGIATGIATFETEIPSWSVWDTKYLKNCRLVAEINNEVVGFAVLSQVSMRTVYKGVAEVTVYVGNSQRGNGIGKLLLQELILESEKHRFWTLQASIFSKNIASIALHKGCGFRLIGTREKIGQHKGIWYDNNIFERRSKKVGL